MAKADRDGGERWSPGPLSDGPVQFFVPGYPQQKGSTRSFINPKTKKVVTIGANPKSKDWQNRCALASSFYVTEPSERAVFVALIFTMQRPKTATVKKRPFPTVTPDLDKLVRGVLDGLTGVIYLDDKQVVQLQAVKVYGPAPGVRIEVGEIREILVSDGEGGVEGVVLSQTSLGDGEPGVVYSGWSVQKHDEQEWQEE